MKTKGFWETDELPVKCLGFMSVVCNHKSSYVALALTFLLLLPFAFTISKLWLSGRYSFNSKFHPGISYSSSLIIFVIMLYYYYYCFFVRQHELTNDTFSRLVAVGSDFYLMSLSTYFISICEILTTMRIRSAKIIYYFSKILQYYFGLATVVKSIMVYLPLSNKVAIALFRDEGFYYKNIILIVEYLINVISFLILSWCFLFSNLKTYLSDRMKTGLHFCLFLFAFNFFIVVNIRVYGYSLYEGQFFYSDPAKYMYRLTFVTYTQRFLVDYVIIVIILILSVNMYNYGLEELSHQISPVNLEIAV